MALTPPKLGLRADLRSFPGLSHHAFQHPLDSQATAALARVPLLPKVVHFLATAFEGLSRSHHIASSVQVGTNQYPVLYGEFVRLAEVLDLHKLPDLFVDNSSEVNAYSMGVEHCSIVVCRGLLDAMEPDELMAVLGHELGHVKCNHMLYRSVAAMLHLFGFALLDEIPGLVGQIAKIGTALAVLEWYRKSELSCDRAAALATQDPVAVQRALAKLAGFSVRRGESLLLGAFVRQAHLYEETKVAESMLIKLMRLQMLMSETHPYPVVRVKELADWAESEQYKRISSGHYLADDHRGPRALHTPVGLACPKCPATWDLNTPFCGACGENLRNAARVCGTCRHLLEPTWRACPQCGQNLTPEAGPAEA